MKKFLILALTIVLALAFTTSAFAIMKGERVYDTKMGKVVFSADTHKAAGKKCGDCHTKIFERKKGDTASKMPKAHQDGAGCGVCHKVADRSNCSSCHKK